MTSHTVSRPKSVCLFVHPDGERGAAFQLACGELFARLQLSDCVEAAAVEQEQQAIDLLVIDLWRLERGADLAAVGALLRQRDGAATLLMCPFDDAAWIPDLMAYGPLDYLITPAADAELRQAVRDALRHSEAAHEPELQQLQLQVEERQLRDVLAIQRALQRALAETDDAAKVAQQICLALRAFPGVRHSALFERKAGGDLQLSAQESRHHLALPRLLHDDERLFQSPLREAFPGVLAAASGVLVLLDAPEKAGHPELAVSLMDQDVRMVLGIPLARDAAGVTQGSLCLMFEQRQRFSREQFACFASLAQLVSFGLAMGELKRRNEQLSVQLTQACSVDELTGAANRREGGHCLAREIGRARRHALPLALIGFDIDGFQRIGERYGQAGGERTLKGVAAATLAILRGADILVRTGDEEFMIIAPHTAALDALKVAEKIGGAIGACKIPGCDGVTISVGVVEVEPEESGAAALQRLEAALYRAKRGGHNGIELSLQAG
ncbi:diguanylate cyclase (GGDEF)-like protein [Oxalobacteraceae bacterium GrIS 1.11]